MSERVEKAPVPLEKVRRYLEPGPIVLVSSAWERQRNIMTMGWHTIMPALRRLLGGALQLLYLGGRVGPCGSVADLPANPPLQG